ncbi:MULTISPECIES: TetR/AcrR family transcriptional regulator [Latilactobacillus]|uniref:TetR/AcrR family transcriptional regulator n=3 Tax=Latilactobacillus curvatus TaxID=28038 RepID=A0A385AG21_LATCU|nr:MULTISPECIES: TetR/AcrR family transcriptional regulator [Latilactobacillus]AXN36571.1 TetR/AcrR family transcriptional regulator [Latilactobacillus curvatus]KRK92598.1 TetR family transcriptional regulator [Latilactobacillus curvatus JCM 1096 = DSM 20019]MCM0725768.1 TetR/AcrR family transcriptional regulator [Latilactobacillus curvatus]MCT3530522.1 TetR/AcrR family transcriptional regulator [Latilactobacillus curvatus]MDG2989122.1 TetR/AcrR family transcriptional regulator [Latilactobacil
MESNLFNDYQEWFDQQEMPAGKRRVLKAGVELFAKQGYDGTSTAQIATQAGVSQATIFKYFKTKQDLLLAIVKPMIHNLLPVVRDEFLAHLEQPTDLPTLVHYIVADRYHFLKTNAALLEILLIQLLVDDQVRQLFLEVIIASRPAFENSVLKTAFEKQLVRAEITISDFIRTIVGQLLAYFFQNKLMPADQIDEATDLARIEGIIINGLQ